MNRKLVIFSVLLIVTMLSAGAAFAATEDTPAVEKEKPAEVQSMLYITAAFGMAFISSVCAIAMSISVKSFCEGVSRNPGTADKLQFGLILTLVLIETLALYVFAVIFMKVV